MVGDSTSETAANRRIDEAWNEINALSESGETERSKQLQKEIGAELFEYYTQHPSTEAGERSLTSAFMMWSNIGDAEAMDAAIPQIDRGSGAWGTLPLSILNGYGNAGRTHDEANKLLQELQGELTHPEGRSVCLVKLADWYTHEGKTRKARGLLKEVIELDAGEWYVDRAKGDIYEMDHLQVGQAAPEFAALDIQGREVRLNNLRGKVVLLEFWSTTCGPCLPEIPHLQELKDEFDDDRLVVLGVALNLELPVLESFLEKKNMTWPQICDQQGYDGPLARSYNVTGIPRSYVIDTEGRIAVKDQRGEKQVAAVRELVAESFDLERGSK